MCSRVGKVTGALNLAYVSIPERSRHLKIRTWEKSKFAMSVPTAECDSNWLMADADSTDPSSESRAIPSDRSLLRGIQKGDDDAAEQLFTKYIQRVDKLAQREFGKEAWGRVDTEDLTQSIFRTLFRRLRDGQYSVPPGDTIWRLLTTVSLNKIRAVGAFHRAAKRDVRRTEPSAEYQITNNAASEDEAAARILRMTIAELIDDLPDAHRQIIELRLENHDVRSISQQINRSKRTVERVLQGFRERLQQVLDEVD